MMFPYRCSTCAKGGLNFFSADEEPVCPRCKRADSLAPLQVTHWHSKTRVKCESPSRTNSATGNVGSVTCFTCRSCDEFRALVEAGQVPMPILTRGEALEKFPEEAHGG